MKKVEIIKKVSTHIENGVEKLDYVGIVTGITKFGDEIGDYIDATTITDQKLLSKIKDFMATATKTTTTFDSGIFGTMTGCFYE